MSAAVSTHSVLNYWHASIKRDEFVHLLTSKWQADALTKIFGVMTQESNPRIKKALFKPQGYFTRLFSSESWTEWLENRTPLGKITQIFAHYINVNGSLHVENELNASEIAQANAEAVRLLQTLNFENADVSDLAENIENSKQLDTEQSAGVFKPLHGKRLMNDFSNLNIREGFYFTNWPPFTFRRFLPEEAGILNGACGLLQYDFNSDDYFILSFRMKGNYPCYLYDAQVACLDEAGFNLLMDDHAGFNAPPPYLFDQTNTSVSDYVGSMERASQILPLNWSFYYMSSRLPSKFYLNILEEALDSLTICEKSAFTKQTSQLALGAAGTICLTLGAILLCHTKCRKKPAYKQIEQVDEASEVYVL
jgi:hypothetical protein